MHATDQAQAIGPDLIDYVRETRALHPERIAQAHAKRQQRKLLTDGRLFIIAADHPARGALGVRDNPRAMVNRYDLLNRLVCALARPGVDGVLATPDIIDDLVLLGALENKVVVGSLNRGGLQGSSFEMDDRMTAYDIASIKRDRLDFAKTLLRINLDDPGTVTTLVANASAITDAAAARVPIMVEPFMTEGVDGRFVNDLTADAIIKATSIASGLGTSSAYTWLKLPVIDDMEAVMEATTLPTLLLGGDPDGRHDAIFSQWEKALTLPGVRGLVVGRTLIYPPDGDVARAVDIAAALVHGAPVPHASFKENS